MKTKKDALSWIYKVINSCKTPQQRENARKLLINYNKQIKL